MIINVYNLIFEYKKSYEDSLVKINELEKRVNNLEEILNNINKLSDIKT